MAKLQENIGVTAPHESFVFAVANLAATQTATAVPIPGGVVDGYTAVKRGAVIGYAVLLSAAFSAGSADIDIEIGGTSTVTIPIDTAATTAYTGTFAYGDHPFDEGDALTVSYTTDGSASPETNDISVVVYVMFDDFNV